ncbi:MAG: alpha-L-rhamnosidase C-terminal domain-containing protein, partial [Solirubrobacteraceae bacterium]
AVISFLHRHVAGIRLIDDEPAYRRFRIEPQPGGGITWAQAKHDSRYGRIECRWRLAGDELELTAVVPPGTTAEIVLPGSPVANVAAGVHSLRTSAARS